jgi:hypothetical protein
VLKRWVDKHYHDFDDQQQDDDKREEARELQSAFLHFVDNVVKASSQAGMAKAAEMLRNQMERKVLSPWDALTVGTTEAPPKPLLPKAVAAGRAYCFLDFSALEVARQLALIEHYMFRQIQPKECLNQARNKKMQHLPRASYVPPS